MRFGVEIEIGTYNPGSIYLKIADDIIIKTQNNAARTCYCQYCTHKDHFNTASYWCTFVLRKRGHEGRVFTIKPDGSLHPGFEVNTPIFETIKDLKYLKDVISLLEPHKVKCTRVCGMHIHIETKFKDRVQSAKGQSILRKMWDETTLPKAFQPNVYRRHHFQLNDGIEPRKYSCVNFMTRYPTLEYRFFNARLDMDYVKEAVQFCQNFSRQLNRNMKEAGLIMPKGKGPPAAFKKRRMTYSNW